LLADQNLSDLSVSNGHSVSLVLSKAVYGLFGGDPKERKPVFQFPPPFAPNVTPRSVEVAPEEPLPKRSKASASSGL
jgi:hypothetical protein